MRGGRIAGYLRFPELTTDYMFDERAILQLARKFDWPYVRFFRDRFDTREQWASLQQALQRGEVAGLVMMAMTLVPEVDRVGFIEAVLKKGVRLVTVAEELDSWSMEGRLWLAKQLMQSES